MSAAWFSVMPVTANRIMPIRQMAELIQCHWCSCLSQAARAAGPLPGLAAEEGEVSAGVIGTVSRAQVSAQSRSRL